MQGTNFWLALTEPYWVLLFFLVAAGFFFKKPGGYIQKVHVEEAMRRRRFLLRPALPVICGTLALAFLIMALVDVTRGYSVVNEEFQTHRIFVAIDNSSSMYNFKYEDEPVYCADKNLREVYPRIYGACRALHRLVDETEAQARRKSGAEKDHISLLRFALYSFVIVPPTSDYLRLRNSIEGLNWREGYVRTKSRNDGQDIFTEIHLALWDLYRLALERNRQKEGGAAYLSLEDMNELVLALFPEGENARFSLPHRFRAEERAGGERVPGLAEKLKEELRDTVFIIITDALQAQLQGRLDKPPVSVVKMLKFAEVLELPVYFISTDETHGAYERLAKETGSGPPGSGSRGDFFLVNQDKGYEHIEELVASILKTRFGKKIPVHIERRESYASTSAFAALIFLIFWVFFKETCSRSLTDV
ncbi:MAG: hypothetical protein HYT30_00390 [Parcubacteria group bacterium]|nr:hypothetical protein [Parcubacteria group bacterium]